MIEGFRHKGLKRLYEEDDRKLLPPELVGRIREILTALEAADSIDGLSRPSFRLHALKGNGRAFGPLPCELIGALSFASQTARLPMSIFLIITRRGVRPC